MSSTKHFDFLLIDCNQFFVSCEEVFNPKLKNQPVVVLSSNDGCVIARSKSAKALGIPMGAPAFQYQELFKAQKVHVFSSNFTLYADMSQRVMHTLSRFSPDMEEYSIDEAFLKVEAQDSLMLAQEIKQTVLKWTGIPVSVGIGKTKTLAKVANDIAKKKDGIFAFSNATQTDTVLETLSVKEIWGIGRNLSTSLEAHGVRNARMFKDLSDEWIQKKFSIVLLRSAYELRGIPCLSLHDVPTPRKSLVCSRSFGCAVTKIEDIEEALASYTAKACEKLRAEELLPTFLTVFLMTSAFHERPYSNSWTITLNEPTSFTPTLVSKAKEALRKIFRSGFIYKKVGVAMGGFAPQNNYQPDLFLSDEKRVKKQKRAMQAIDNLKQRFGNESIRFAAEGLEQRWKIKRKNVSLRYTTCWNELLKIEI